MLESPDDAGFIDDERTAGLEWKRQRRRFHHDAAPMIKSFTWARLLWHPAQESWKPHTLRPSFKPNASLCCL